MGASSSSSYAYVEKAQDRRASPPSVGVANSPTPGGAVQAAQTSTNSFMLDMSRWNETPPPITGDPIRCQRCDSYFSHVSKTELQDDGRYKWRCEFCSEVNMLDIDEEEIPKTPQTLYVLSAAPTGEVTTDQGDIDSADQSSLVFCIDISGSMNVKYKGISRLNCVKQAILEQLNAMKSTIPNRRIKLVCFERRVRVYGDFKHVLLDQKAHSNFEECLQFGRQFTSQMSESPISESFHTFSQVIQDLNPTGMTALGPALSVSVGLAERGNAGSQVIICTDGLANIGLGAFEGLSTDEQELAAGFYERIGAYARERGISISVISIEGAECKLNFLADMVDLTGGAITKVDPDNLSSDFAFMLSDRIMATNVIATATLHKALKFENEDENTLSHNGSRMSREIGNLTAKSRFTIQYSLKPQEQLDMEEIDLEQLTEVPFQLIIQYNTPMGATYLRVLSMSQPVTNDQEVAEANVNLEVYAANYQMHSAKMVEEGNFEDLQVKQQYYHNVISKNIRSSEDERLWQNVQNVDMVLNSHINLQMAEERKMGYNYAAAPKMEQKRQRRNNRGDGLSSLANKMKKKW